MIKEAMLNTDPHLTKLVANLKLGDPVPVPPEPRRGEEIMAKWVGDLDKPLVSIICHTFNHAAFVKDALNAFLMQRTDFPFEIILHDDASTDGTDNILRDYQSRYPHLLRLIIQEENQYKQGRRPQGFSFPLAKGKYIAFCEGDDYWIDENKISKQAAFLDANPDVSIVYTDSVSFSDNCYLGRDFGGAKLDLTQEELKESPDIFTLTTCFRNIISYPIELNFVGYGDKFIWSRLGHVGRGKYMDDILPSFYRVHEKGVHSSADSEDRLFMMFKTFVAMSSYYERIGDDQLSNYFLQKAIVIAYILNGVSIKLIPIMKAMTSGFRRIKRFKSHIINLLDLQRL